ncbi:MAG TPA: GNAT family N-acetyltransferase [Acidobacteriota bacterium]|nr:GNAT family N-acetyltransferase [Acidobacteriota bacterium]
MRKHFITDMDECQKLWESLIRPRWISDLWEFRLCFHRHFNCKPCFLVLEDRKGLAGMLPLSYIPDGEMFVFFPGETWKGKTWIERTPYYLRGQEFLPDLLLSCPERTYLRYMEIPEESISPDLEVDEIGYVLYPSDLDFDLSLYRQRFSNKKFKSIIRTIKALTGDDGTFHSNRLEDFEAIVDLSLQNFGTDSYLDDYRFRESVRDMMYFFDRINCLRMVSIEINGTVVAVDLGAAHKGSYTLFLGGTHQSFPGIAKVMNMNHVEFAFNQGLRKIDFLCGDFHWKKLWHLDPEPLYKHVSPALTSREGADYEMAQNFPDFVSRDQSYA